MESAGEHAVGHCVKTLEVVPKCSCISDASKKFMTYMNFAMHMWGEVVTVRAEAQAQRSRTSTYVDATAGQDLTDKARCDSLTSRDEFAQDTVTY